jgi:hypothetical protein
VRLMVRMDILATFAPKWLRWIAAACAWAAAACMCLIFRANAGDSAGAELPLMSLRLSCGVLRVPFCGCWAQGIDLTAVGPEKGEEAPHVPPPPIDISVSFVVLANESCAI